jgi:iron complex outermembrane receptor protein
VNLAAAVALLLAIPAAAAQTEGADGAAGEAVEVLLVTAERREAGAGDVPISLSVSSGEMLDASGTESSYDLQLRVPGLVFSTSSVLGQPYLRGVGSDLISTGADASLGTFVDGVYQSRAVGALQDFYDVERVEVLRGPQGTLFGRNTTAGAVRIFTRKPEPDFSVESDLLYGNFDKLRWRGSVNVPISDQVITRLSALHTQRDGFTDNSFLGKDLDGEGRSAVRGQLLFEPNNRASLLLRGDYTHERSTRGLAPKVSEPLASSPAVGAGALIPAGPRDVLNDTSNSASVDLWGVSVEGDLEFDGFAFESLTAFRRSEYAQRLDSDATELPFAVVSPDEVSNTFSQELQLTSTHDGRVQWLGGVFYLHEDAEQDVDLNALAAGVRDRTGADLETNSVGVFGEASVQFWDAFRASAGLRYSYEHRSQDFHETVNGAPVADFDQTADWDAWSPRFTVEYAVRDDALLYASISRGFKSGGFNSSVAQAQPFDPEFMWAYEAGLKLRALAGRARLDLAGFYYDYKDIQLAIPRGLPFPEVVNAGHADIWGLEVQGQLVPVEALELEASLAYLDATFSDLTAIDANNPGSDPDRSGNRMPRAPEFSAFVAAQYRAPVHRFGTLTPRVEYRYQSEIFFNLFEDDYVRQAGYGIWNLRLTYESRGRCCFVAGFARNLGDKLYAQNVIRADPAFGTLAFWGAPRTYGFQIGGRY